MTNNIKAKADAVSAVVALFRERSWAMASDLFLPKTLAILNDPTSTDEAKLAELKNFHDRAFGAGNMAVTLGLMSQAGAPEPREYVEQGSEEASAVRNAAQELRDGLRGQGLDADIRIIHPNGATEEV